MKNNNKEQVVVKKYQLEIIKIVAAFFAVCLVWILVLHFILIQHIRNHIAFAISNGIIYLVLTAILLYALLYRYQKSTRKTEEALIMNEERYRNIVEASSDWIWEVDQDGKYTYVSKQIKGILGYESEEIIGKTPFDFMPPDEAEKVKKVFIDFRENRKPIYGMENTNYHKNGSMVVLETNGVPIINKDGKLCGYRGMDKDITVRKLAEEQLRIKDFAVKSALSAIGLADMSGKIIFANEAYIKLWGYSDVEEVLGTNISEFISSEKGANDFHKEIVSTLQSGKGFFGEGTAVKKDGTQFSVQLSANLVLSPEGEPISIMASFNDITERKHAEEELRRTIQVQSLILNNNIFGVAYMRNRTFEWVNPELPRMFGMGINEISEHNTRFLYNSDEEFEENGKKLLQKFSNNEKFEYEIKRNHNDGTIFIGRIVGQALDPSSPMGESIWLFEDITERKKTEEELKKINQIQSVILNSNLIGIVYLRNHIVQWVNDKLPEMLGKNSKDINGQHIKIAFCSEEDYNEKSRKAFENFALGKKYEYEVTRQHSDGNMFIGRVVGQALDYQNPNEGSIWLFEDITTRKQAEKELKVAHQKLSDIIEFLPDATFVIDKEKKVTAWNHAAEEMTGIKKEEIIGKGDYPYAIPLYGERRPILIDLVQVNGSMQNDKYEFIKRNWKTIYSEAFIPLLNNSKGAYISGVAAPLFDSEGNFSGAIESIRNITEQKQIEQELDRYRTHLEDLIRERTNELEIVNDHLKIEIEKQKEAEEKVKKSLEKEMELNELKTRFISTATHELRTPLAIILSSADLLELFSEKWDKEKNKKQLKRIKTNIKKLTRIVDDIFNLGRVDNKKMVYVPRYINLENLCRNVVEDIAELSSDKQIIDFLYLIEEKNIIIDETLMRLILSNLLSNAVKYSIDNKDIGFAVSKENDSIVFMISDKGIGIPESDQKHLFDSFYRGSNVDEISGTGLGLSIVKKAVELQNGTIEYTSKVDIGTTFIVQIPFITESKIVGKE